MENLDERSVSVRAPGEPRAWLGRWLDRSLAAMLAALGWIACGVASLRFSPIPPPFPFSAIEAEAQWMLPISGLALLVAARRNARWAIVLNSLAVLALLFWTFEWIPSLMIPRAHFAQARSLRIMTANLLAPNPSTRLARELLDSDADILLLQELSDPWWELLRAEGVADAYPYGAVEPHSTDLDFMGIGLLSRLPLVDAETTPLVLDWVPVARAHLVVDGRSLCIYSVHTLSPVTPDLLDAQMRQTDALTRLIRSELDAGNCSSALVGGDFNASATSRAHRVLRNAGWLDAHERVGRAFVFTWPNGRTRMPPMRLDHLYLIGGSHVEVEEIREGEGLGSDHRPVIATLTIEAGHQEPIASPIGVR